MKKILIASFLALAVVSCVGRNSRKKASQAQNTAEQTATVPDTHNTHNSRNSLDYEGTYTGIFPCADCPGIQVRITIDREGNFMRTMAYIEKQDIFTSQGTFVWDDTGSIITLNDGDDSVMFRVGENTLTMLDYDGNPITGDLADMFILQKAATAAAVGTPTAKQ